MITNEDRRMISYFINHKGDITRWTGWENKKAQVQEEYPELIAALNAVEVAERTLEAIVSKIESDDDGGDLGYE